MNRRTFLKMGGISALCSLFAPRLARRAFAQDGEPNYWIGSKYFIQDTVETGDLPERIWARIGGSWHVYPSRQLPQEFVDWNLAARVEMLEAMAGGQMTMSYDGPHNAAVATVSRFGRGDSEFTINNAYKGMGMVPRPDRIDEILDLLHATADHSLSAKLQILIGNYSDETIWDRTKQGSLELYTTAGSETHSFRNQMRNPISTVVFLDSISYELRTIARLMHPNDPTLTDDEKKMVDYVNTVHNYFHGGPTNIIVAIYYVVEVFDNSPGTYEAGYRVVPPLDRARALKSSGNKKVQAIGY
ncbi:MAG: hypothetical protein JW941_06290 [Candidatus Coatesbacteria bacterium]|nr:hypothetical protein [Candidatus Coatesbacteria bacterium]